MMQLGTTFRSFFETLAPAAVDKATATLREAFDLGDDAPMDEFLDSNPDSGPFSMGGYFFKLENIDDIAGFIMETGAPDLLVESDGVQLLDMADFLMEDESVAILQMCTNDAGGNVYIADKELLNEFPSIRSHVNAVLNA